MNRRARRRAEAQQRKEDKTVARRMVEEDARRAGHIARELRDKEGIPSEFFARGDPLPDDPTGGEGLLINLVIGTRDRLTAEEAKATAQQWLEITRKYPKASVYVYLLGYDEDPREIPQIRSAAKYVRQWARFAGIKDFEEAAAGHEGWIFDLSLLVGTCTLVQY